MNEALHPDLSSGVAGALGMLRHALADPLSSAGLRLEYVERRLAAAAPGEPALADRLRGAKADLGVADRLIDLLPRLGRLADEAPVETSLGELCRVAGIPLEGEGAGGPRLPLRRVGTADALRALVRLLRPPGPAGAPPLAILETDPERASLRFEAPGSFGADPERLFRLPRGEEQAEELFLARAAVESDGGRVALSEREGRRVALVSWPLPAASRPAGRPA